MDIQTILKLELADPIEKRDRKIIAFLEENNIPWRYCGYESYASGKVRQFLHPNILSLLRSIIYTHYLEPKLDLLAIISNTLVDFVYLSTNTYEQNNKSQAIQLDSKVFLTELHCDREVGILLEFIQTISSQPKVLEYTITLLLGYCVKKLLYLADCIEKEGKPQQADLIRASLYPNQFVELEDDYVNCNITNLPAITQRTSFLSKSYFLSFEQLLEVVESLYSKNGELEYINSQRRLDSNWLKLISQQASLFWSQLNLADLDPKIVFPQMLGLIIFWKDGFGLLSPILNPLADIPILGIPFGLLDTNMFGRTLATFIFAYFLPRNNPIRSLFWGENKVVIGITAGFILTSILLV